LFQFEDFREESADSASKNAKVNCCRDNDRRMQDYDNVLDGKERYRTDRFKEVFPGKVLVK
jgi:hypothetical protein